MNKKLIKQAIDAAAKARSDQWSAETIRNGPGWTWDELTPEDQAKCIEWVTPIVTVALTEVVPSIQAEALRKAAHLCNDDGDHAMLHEEADRIEQQK